MKEHGISALAHYLTSPSQDIVLTMANMQPTPNWPGFVFQVVPTLFLFGLYLLM